MTSAILIHRNNQQTGPFPEEQVRQMLADGRLAATDLAWRQGDRMRVNNGVLAGY